MEETKQNEKGCIVNHNTNCQVFNAPISGSIFAMPGSHVENHPIQTVAADGSVSTGGEGPKANDDRLLVPIPDDLPIKITRAPEETIKGATNTYVIKTLQEAGATCNEPWHFACLMAVCDDHGILKDRTNLIGFARTMVAWGIKPFESEEGVKQLANSIRYTMNELPLRYKEWGDNLRKFKDKCENLATYFGKSMPYRYGIQKP